MLFRSWEFISAKFPSQTTLLLGVAFLLIVYFIPHGVIGLIEDSVKRGGILALLRARFRKDAGK